MFPMASWPEDLYWNRIEGAACEAYWTSWEDAKNALREAYTTTEWTLTLDPDEASQEIANNNEETEEELHQPSNLPPQQQEQTLLEELASTAALYNPEEHHQGTENEIFNQ